MPVRRIVAALILAAAAVSLSACAKEGAVYVQSVKTLMSYGALASVDRFPGVVISEDVTKIEKGKDKTIEALFVKEGDDVKKGQKLFAYDTEELQLTLDKQRLEVEQLKASIENLQTQITTLQNAINTVNGSTKLKYTIQIQTNQVDLKEAQLKLKTKEAEVKKSENLLEHAVVTSPIDGRIQSVNEDGKNDSSGNTLPYITIQKTGAYRLKGMLGELQQGSIREGDRLTILSRTDDRIWKGTVTLVDYENPTRGNGADADMGGNGDEMSSASRYPFYADIDNMDGLLLGQHVYLELEQEEADKVTGLCISSDFIGYDDDGNAFVWMDRRGKLVRQPVMLGTFYERMGLQQIVDGLSEDDYIAFPDPAVCVEGAAATRHKEAGAG